MAGVFDIELEGGEPHRYDGGSLQEEMEDDQMYSNVADVSSFLKSFFYCLFVRLFAIYIFIYFLFISI